MVKLRDFATVTALASLVSLGIFADHGAAGAELATALPQLVADWIAQARSECPSGFTDQGAVRQVDLTGDGRPGYVADPHAFFCAGSPHLFGGSAPASIELFVTMPSGNVVHTGGVLALGYRLDPSPAGAPTLVFDTHDIRDEAGSLDTYRWNGHDFARVSHTSMAAPPIQ